MHQNSIMKEKVGFKGFFVHLKLPNTILQRHHMFLENGVKFA